MLGNDIQKCLNKDFQDKPLVLLTWGVLHVESRKGYFVENDQHHLAKRRSIIHSEISTIPSDASATTPTKTNHH